MRRSGRKLSVLLGGAILLAVASAAAAQEEAKKDGVKFDEEGITATFANGDAELNIGGRLYLDAADAWIDSDLDAFEDNFEVRQARIEAELTVLERYTGVFQYDFADEEAPYKDVGAGFKVIDPVVVSVGNFKEPFSMEELTSDNDIDLMERSLADTFAPGRALGAAVTASDDHWTAALGVFGGDINDDVDDDGVAVTARGTWAPINEEEGRRLVHLGVAASYRDPDGSGASFSTGPESHLFELPLVDAGSLDDATDIFRGGLEAAGQWGKFRLQGEYEVAHVERGGAPDATFHGGYLAAGYTINGNGRPYKTEDSFGTEIGVFDGVELEDEQRVTKGGIGVFEAVGRVSYIDLEDAPVDAGRQRNVSVGLNWYPEKNIRLMGNYIYADAEDSPETGADVEAHILQGRLQIAF